MLLPMTDRPRPAANRTPRALRRRRGGWVLAALAGGVGAVLLIGWLLPTDTGEPLATLDGPVVVEPVLRPVVPASEPSPPPSEVAAAEPEPVEERVEVPSAEDRQWFQARVFDADGNEVHDAWLLPVDCEGFDYDVARRLHSAVAPGSCTVEAATRDGALMRRSDQVTVRLVAGAEPQVVRLELPSERTGGIGVRFMPTGSGMRVLSVVEGGPAWEAGLEVGDVIISVDGEAVDGLDQQEFVRRMTGPEGSSVEFEISYRDDVEEPSSEPVVERVRVRRRYLDG